MNIIDIFITDIKTKYSRIICNESSVHTTMDGYSVSFILNNIIYCTINIPLKNIMNHDEIKQYIENKLFENSTPGSKK